MATERRLRVCRSGGWGSTDENEGTPVWYLDFGKNVDWSNLRFVAPPS